jgi:hypothetical protein
MQGSIVDMFDIGKTHIPCARVIGIIHAQDMHDHLIYDLSFSIFLGWKAMDLLSFVSNNDKMLDQNVLINRLSRYETMVCGIPKCTKTRSKKSL